MYGPGDICGMSARVTVGIGGYGKSRGGGYRGMDAAIIGPAKLCLLYTSDAADE